MNNRTTLHIGTKSTQRGSAATKRIEYWGLEVGVMGASLRRYHPNPPALRRGV